MRRNEKRPQAVPGPRGARKNTWGADTPHVAASHQFVNAILFRLRSLAGLLSCGFWAERTCLWIVVLDQAARLLRDTVEGRI